MRLFGAAAGLERFEDGDGLRFRATSQRTVGALIVPALAALGLVYAWSQDVDELGLLGLAAILALTVWRWFKVRIVELRVTAAELVAEGDLDPEKGTIWLQWLEIAGLHYLHGAKETSGGLYARGVSGTHVCLVPYVSQAQANEMIRTIYDRFPHVARSEEMRGDEGLFGSRSEPMELSNENGKVH